MLTSKCLAQFPDSLMKSTSLGNHPFPRHLRKPTASFPKMTTMAAVVVRASGYRKRPMETPGAYELIDDNSGERVIVWGGVGDEDVSLPIPPKHVLSSWTSDQKLNPNPNQGSALPASVQNSNTPKQRRSGGSSRTFGRLKVNKVRDLVKKVSKGKRQHIAHDVYEEPGDEHGTDSNEEEEYIPSDSEDADDEFTSSTMTQNKLATLNRGVDQLSRLRQDSSRKMVDGSFGNISSNPSVVKRGWGGRQSSQDAWRRNTSSRERELKDRRKQSSNTDFFSRRSFKELGCSDDMIKCLEAQLFLRPSHIQSMAFEPVLEGKSCIVADQSGSGKTLAYLVPIIQRLRDEELQGISKSSSRSPRAVILVPTAELASQVLRNCRSMSKLGMQLRSMVATGGFRQKTQLENLEQDLDILIATPGRFMYLITEGFLQLGNLKCAVLDEVDILFGDEDFEVALQSLATSSPVTTQYVFVTATLPVGIYNKLVEVFPDCEVVMGPTIHRTSSGLEEVLVDCSGEDGSEKSPETAFANKKAALLRLVEENPVAKTIVFCNKIETCRKVENALKRFDRKGNEVKVLPFHAAMAQESRLTNMKQFLESQPLGNSLVLICTDRASRGIDFAGVDHVMLFDFPRDPSEYVRRVGRTARGAGGKGKAFVFVVGKQVSLAKRIMERNLKGHPLHEVPSSYEPMR